MTLVRDKYGIEGVLYLGVVIIASALTIGFSAFSYLNARDARTSALQAAHSVDTLCNGSNDGRTMFNTHFAGVLRNFLLAAAGARMNASRYETGQQAREDIATAAAYHIYAKQATDLPLLHC